IKDLTGTSISGSCSLGSGSCRNEGNMFTALWQYQNDSCCKIRDDSSSEKVVLKYIDLDTSVHSLSTTSSSTSPFSSQYRTLLRSALAPRMSKKSCPFIIPLQCIFYDEHVHNPSRKGAYLVFPYYAHKDMFSWITNTHPDFEAVKHVLICVLSALAHLHSQFIVHCDLKPTNILIDSFGNGILCDFEGSIDCSERTMRLLSQTMYIGTPGYIAPELSEAIKEHSRPHPTPASDMYSFGMLLKDVFDMLSDVCDISIPSEFSKMRTMCMNSNPKDRPTSLDILILLKTGRMKEFIMKKEEEERKRKEEEERKRKEEEERLKKEEEERKRMEEEESSSESEGGFVLFDLYWNES
ncbi:hypothetical protein ADUPG1_009292, partial [Aduncisulcus paluster]